MPFHKSEEDRILPLEGSESYPAYKVKRTGRPTSWRFIIRRPNRADEIVEEATLAEIRFARQKAERTAKEHQELTFERAIPLYLATVYGPAPSEKERRSMATERSRLEMFFEPAMKLPVARLTADLGEVLYTGKIAPRLDEEGNPIVLVKGLIHRPTKRPKGRGPKTRQPRGSGKRYQACQICGVPGHNRRVHTDRLVPDPPPEPVFELPAVATHRAALSRAKVLAAWLLTKGYVRPGPDGKHPLMGVLPTGKKGKKKNDGGFGKCHLTPAEQIILDETCVWVLEHLAGYPERERIVWQQRAVAVMLLQRCGVRSGELRTAKRRQFTIEHRPCSSFPCGEEHGGHTGGTLKVVYENAKTRTSEEVEIPIPPSSMGYVLPLLEGKTFEQFLLAGKPEGGAPWDRDPNVGPMSQNWLGVALKHLCGLGGIRLENPHGLRGAFTATKLKQGDPFKEVSEAARHTSMGVTERHYADKVGLTESQQRIMAKRLGYSIVTGKRAN